MKFPLKMVKLDKLNACRRCFLNIVFFGSPAEVLSPLQHLVEGERNGLWKLSAIVSQPARPAGRGKKLLDPPIAQFAKNNDIPLFQFKNVNEVDSLSTLKNLDADIFITAAYGQILSDEFLTIPKRATINIHPSILPKYRGATPVNAALLNGDKKTGVTILFTVKKLDAGNIICQEEFIVPEKTNAGEMTHTLFSLSCSLINQAIELLKDPDFEGILQDESQVSHCRKIAKNDGKINWNAGCHDIIRQFQAYTPWPGLFTFLGDKRVVITDLDPARDSHLNLDVSGQFEYHKPSKAIIVKCSDGYLALRRLKPAGSKEQDAASFANGIRNLPQNQFTSEDLTHE